MGSLINPSLSWALPAAHVPPLHVQREQVGGVDVLVVSVDTQIVGN